MRGSRAEKYRDEVRKVNTGINRIRKVKDHVTTLRQGVETIQRWSSDRIDTMDEATAWLKTIAKKCKRLLEQTK